MIIKLKDNPVLQALIKKAVPSYRKHNIIVFPCNSVTCHGGAWSGGSRSSYLHVNLTSGHTDSISVPTAPPQFGGGADPVIELEADRGVISVGTFRGKTATLTLYIHDYDVNYLEVRCDEPTRERSLGFTGLPNNEHPKL